MKKIILLIFAKSVGAYINILSYIAPKKSLSLAYKLFSEPRKGKLTLEKLPRTLQKAKHHSYTFNEHTIQTYTWTSDETKLNEAKENNDIIFLIHGWESNGSRWKKLLKHLVKSGKTIIAIDAPAHGLSSGKEFNVPTYAAFIDYIAQKFPPKIIIGHSVGGNASAYYQANYNHNLEKMVLLGSPCDLKIIFDNFIKMLSLNKKVYKQIKVYSNKRFNIDIETFSVANLVKECAIDGIIAHDQNDDVVLITEAKKIADSWKKAKYIETKGFGHSLHDEKLYQTLTEFVAN